MNSSSKLPPRFVPTLTEVVQPEALPAEESQSAMPESPLDQSLGRVTQGLSPQPEKDSARPSFHSPWLADGLYVRSQSLSIPHQLPPLPDSLPPQQPFAQSAEVQELASDQAEEQPESVLSVALAESSSEPQQAALTQESVDSEEETECVDGVEIAAEPPVFQEALPAEVDPALSAAASQSMAPEAVQIAVTEEDLVHRLMQRVDLVLEQRLKDAIAQVVEAQTRAMMQRVREEVETVVRQSVYEAVAAELAQSEQP